MAAFLLRTISLTAAATAATAYLLKIFSRSGYVSWFEGTAGLPISWTVGQLHNFCCRGPILIPGPDSETSAQTTRTDVLTFFVKPKTGISAFYTKRR